MIVNDIMTADYTYVKCDASIYDALQIILKNNLSGISVINKEGDYVGYVSNDDLLYRYEVASKSEERHWLNIFVSIEKSSETYIREHALYISELATRTNIVVDKFALIHDAVSLMTRENVNELPVSEDGKLVGMISKLNILNALVNALFHIKTEIITDDEIAAAIHIEFAKCKWVQGISYNVVKGTVTLSGNIFDDKIRSAARVAIENIGGLTQIIDNMVISSPELSL